MSHYLKLTILLLLALSTSIVRANTLNKEKLLKVSSSRYWKNLLHFNEGLFKSESYADSDSFFISVDGKKNLLSELEANVKAFQVIENRFTPENIPAQCAFPERFNFIKKSFPEISFIEAECPNFKAWKGAVVGPSVSLVFASSFVNNPSSMFGHTFLKFNKRNQKVLSEDMFNYVVSFAAKAEDDPGFLYAVKGLFGGYKGIVDVQPFYQTLREYSKVESRDIWDYELNLSQSQINSLINHIWELYANANFDYYFFDENCTSVLARLISLVYKDDLHTQMSMYALPTDFLRILVSKDIVKQASYHPSLRKQFFANYNELSTSQKNTFKDVFNNLKSTDDKVVLNSLVHYYDYIRHDHENEVSTNFKQGQKNVLSMASKVGTIESVSVKRPVSPDEGHLPVKASLAFGQGGGESIASFSFRPSFHSLNDPARAYEPWSHIELFKFKGVYNLESKKLLFNEFSIAEIQSLPDFKSLDTNTSWSLDLKILPLYEENRINAHKGRFNLNMGLSKHNEFFLFSFLTGATLEGHNSFKNKFKLGPNLKINVGLNIFNTKIVFENLYFYSLIKSHSKRDYMQTKIQINMELSRGVSVTLEGLRSSSYGKLSQKSYEKLLGGVSFYY